ncbi:unnamed protein product, partial [Coregonus sp. 'balchen']
RQSSDYDYTVCPEGEKKLSKSTYKHFGTNMDADWSTSTETYMSQYLLKKEYEPKKIPKSMVEADHFQSADFDRHTVRVSTTLVPELIHWVLDTRDHLCL